MTNNADTTPDRIFYSSNIRDAIKKLELTPDLGSDHLSLVVSIDLNTALPTKIIETKMNYRKANIENINAEVQTYQTATENVRYQSTSTR